MYNDICLDMVVQGILDTDNLKVWNMFQRLDFIIKNFSAKKFKVMVDLNSRCASLNNDRYHYLGNPGINLNVIGQKMLIMCTEKNLVSDNWLILDDKQSISRVNLSQLEWEVRMTGSSQMQLIQLILSDLCQQW